MNALSWTFLVFLGLMMGVEYWLNRRQKMHVGKHMKQVPEAFTDRISLEAHQKAARYTFARLDLANISLLYSSVLLLAWTLGGGLQFIHAQLAGFALDPLLQGTLLILLVMVLMSLLDLPLSAWSTFGLEEKFGFNRETPAGFLRDQLLNLLLMVMLGGPLTWVILKLMAASGNFWWLYAWLVWIGFVLFMTWTFPNFIAPLFNRFEPLQDKNLQAVLEKLLQRCGFKSSGMYVMDGSRRSSHGNAYFTGFGTNKRIVFYDTLLEQLDATETEAVLAHELGHFKRHHIIKRLVSMSVISLAGFALLGWLKLQPAFYHGLGVNQVSDSLALLLFVMVAPVFSFFLQPVSAWFSRKQEFEADEFALQQSSGLHLISALVKMYRDNASTLTPDPWYSAFHHSHPPAGVRIAHISSKMQTSTSH